MKLYIKGFCTAAFLISVVNCAPSKMETTSNTTPGSVVETSTADIVTLPLEQGTLLKAPSNDLPLEVSDLPSDLITLITPPSNSGTEATAGGFLDNLFGGSDKKCGILNTVLSIGSSFLAASNPLLAMLIPKLASSLLKCGSSSGLANMIPVGASGKEQVFALLSQVLQANNQGKDMFALINAIKNPKDLNSLLQIVDKLTAQTSGNAELKKVLALIKDFKTKYGDAVGQCGNMNSKACKVFLIINELRSKNGLQALVPNLNCVLAAQSHSKDMFENNILSHTSSDGMSSKARLEKFGLVSAVENIIKGNSLSAEQAVEMWMNSQGHKNNILNAAFTGGGVGFINGYFTQCFTK